MTTTSTAKVLSALGLVVVVLAVATACSIWRGSMNQQLSTEGNLANQRKVAVKLIRDYPHPALESIRYTREGSVDGGGSWSANAVVTVDGKRYHEILGTFVSIGDELPPMTVGALPAVKVVYSDHSSELIK